MASITVYRTSAFTDASRGGNEAGVALDAGGLGEETMQSIAKTIGYSETAFIRSIEDATIHVRYFTPTSEVPLCGHATIALLNLLRHVGRISVGDYTLHTVAGAYPVKVSADRATLLFRKPKITTIHDPYSISRSLALDARSLDSRIPVASVDAGVRELYVGLSDSDTLKGLDVDREAILRLSERTDVSGVVFYHTGRDECIAEIRNFLPAIGIGEESATGTAAAALTTLIHTYTSPFGNGVIRQGESLGKPSRINVTVREDGQSLSTIEISGTFRVIDTVDVTL